MTKHSKIDEEEVKRLHVEEDLTIDQIADMPGMTQSLARIVEVLCWCKIPLGVHIKCDGCGILVGPKHITKTVEPFLDGAYCSTCLKDRKKLECFNCGAHQIWYDHEIVEHLGGDIMIDGICRACDRHNKFINRRPVSTTVA